MPWCDHGIMESQFGTALLDDLKGPDSDSHCGLSKLRGWVSVDPRSRKAIALAATIHSEGTEYRSFHVLAVPGCTARFPVPVSVR